MTPFCCIARRVIAVLVLLVCMSTHLCAQTADARITGLVTDSSKAVIRRAEVVAINNETGVRYPTSTNASGIYSLSGLPVGQYRIEVENQGFKSIVMPGVILHVQDVAEINFEMAVGSTAETVTVDSSGININTTDASVSTVVDRQFVENMPLNGRSFQDLILLTPGTVTNSPQSGYSIGRDGEFSVNGQRTESNYYTIDGVSANVNIVPGVGPGPATSGSVAASTALGTTQGLMSVDALQEFRVDSSTYSAELGRNPGAQISFTTRSGTNQLHGALFEYLRNNYFDANDWFTDYYSQTAAALRQNDFGGTLGGPVKLFHFYDGTDKTFFFMAYEGLRLMQPQPAAVTYAPDAGLRQSAPAALQPVLNAFPLPNGPDLGNGLGEYIGTWSNPSSLDAGSIRLDHALSENWKLFFRFSDTPSSTANRPTDWGPASGNILSLDAKTYTLGATGTFSKKISNDLRFNFTNNSGDTHYQLYQVANSTPVSLAQLAGISTTQPYAVVFTLEFPGYDQILEQYHIFGAQNQWNVVDTTSFALGRHTLKAGVDFRQLTPDAFQANTLNEYIYSSATAVETNSGTAVAESIGNAHPLYQNFSAFVQDEWRATERLNVSMGLRWEVNPAPGATKGLTPYTVEGTDLSTLTLAPEGTPLWRTTWYNFAPRLGIAYIVHNNDGAETVFRAGGGVFFDTGQQLGSYGYQGLGFTALKIYGGAAFPLTQAQSSVSIVNPPVAPYGTIFAYPQHLQLPYTWQWNTSLQQGLGKSQSLTLSYVGSYGSRLLEENEVDVGAFNPNFTSVYFFQSGLTSDYNALEAQFQRSLLHGATALVSYTWSHCLDYGSENYSLAYERGNCDYDVRSNFASALTYNIPGAYQNVIARALGSGWGVDDRFAARGAFPVTLYGSSFVDPGTGQTVQGELNIVPATPIYLQGPQYPGRKAVNPAAFQLPASGEQGNAPRNFVRGFGEWQMDVAARREFSLRDQLKLQFRAEAFNVFNHPNFGEIYPYYGGAQFGLATATLANSLGILNPLYQQGGPRSMQFALKLTF